MALDTNFNANPYYDDYDEDKKFLRMLFKPGFAVQARELTQLQTILQKQVERFGDHVFKKGSIITGGQTFLQNATYLKLEDLYSGVEISIANFENKTILSADESKRAEVLDIIDFDPLTGDPRTLMVKQILGEPFAPGDTIKTNETAPIFAIIGSESTDVGTGQIFSISEGVFYYSGFFVRNLPQTITLSKYTSIGNDFRIGFEVVESIVDTKTDSSLLDPAQNASNYQAPGADRFKIDLVLSKRTLESEDDERFIELTRLRDSELNRSYIYPLYSVLEDTLARRTYDESGNYTVRPFKLSLETNTSNTAQTDVILSPGKAYVFGYEFETNEPTVVTVDKPRETGSVENSRIPSDYGYFVYTNDHRGAFPINTLNLVDVHCVAQSSINLTSTGSVSNTKIGTARIKNIEFDSSANTANASTYEYKTFLFDIKIDQSITGNVVSCTDDEIILGNTVSGRVYSTVADAYVGAKIRITSGIGSFEESKTIIAWDGSTQTATVSEGYILEPDANSVFSIDFEFKNAESFASISGTTLSSSASIDSRSKDDATVFQNAFISESTSERLVFRLGERYIQANSISDLSYSYRRLYSNQEFSSSVSPALPVGSYESITEATTDSAKSDNYYVTVTDAGSSPYVVGQVIPSNLITVDTDERKLTIVSANNMRASIIATIDYTGISGGFTPKTKSFVQANTTIQSSGGVDVFNNSAVISFPTQGQTHIASSFINKTPNEPQSLFVSDVNELISVLDFNGSVISEANAASAIDVTGKYILDDGQRDSFYDHASIRLKSSVRPPVGPLVVKYNRFRSSGAGFFTVDSYSSIDYGNIPLYSAPTGTGVFELRDCLDFRPVRADSTFGSGNTVTFDVDSSTTGPKIPKLGESIVMDYEYYLPRIDKVVLDKNRTFSVIKGNSKLNPETPNDRDTAMTLYVLTNNAYVANTADISVEYKNNRRYTMRDIGGLEKRVENLEYYTSLSLLEQSTVTKTDLTILDSQNLPRFKNGILVDAFKGSSVADVTDADYRASIDPVRNELRPSFNISSYNLTFDANTSQNYLRSGPLITANAASTLLIDQPKASQFINVNPFNVINFLGKITLNPSSDIWLDTDERADVLVNLEGDRDAWALLTSGAHQTEWGSWQTTWTGVDTTTRNVQNNHSANWQALNAGVGGRNDIVRHTIETTTERQQRSGVLSQVVPQTIVESLGNRVVDVSVIPYMRSINVLFVGVDFKPNSLLYPFFDGKSAQDYVGNRVNKFVMAQNNLQFKTNLSDPEFVNIKNVATGNIVGTAIVVHTSNNVVFVTNVDPSADFTFIASGAQLIGQTSGLTYDVVSYEHNGADCDGGTSTTITLRRDAAGSSNASGYVGKQIRILQGTGVGQVRTISAYNTSTRVATVSVAWDTIPDTSSIYGIGGLRADESGAVAGIFTIPTGIFRVGEKLFRLTDTPSGDIPSATTSGDASFFASGLLLTTEETIVSATVPQLQRTLVNDTQVVTNSITTSRRVIWTDPLAQTFLVSPIQYPEGLFVSKIRVAFKSKDNNVPVTLQVRPTVNGYPSSAVIYPYGSVTLTPDKVKVSDSPDINDANKYTDFIFDAPLYMQPGEHSFVLLANSNKYEMWVAEIERLDLVSGRQISEQPYGGSFFLSQNGSTWTADQDIDMMFQIYRYEFSTSPVIAQFLLDVPETEETPYDLVHLITADVQMSDTSLNYEFNSETLSGGYADYKAIDPLINYEMKDGSGTRLLTPTSGNLSFLLKSTMGTLNTDVSPFIDVTRLGFLAVHNQINNLTLSDEDIVLLNGGDGYANSTDVTITISGGGGSGAIAEANVVANVIQSITIVDPGSGYTGSPTITITPGSGGGANASAIIVGEDSKRGGPARARYISRRVTLNDGFDSGDLRVYLTAYKPSGTNIYVYAKMLSGSDPDIFEDKEWQLLTQLGNTNYVSLSEFDYRELLFAPGTNGEPDNAISYVSGTTVYNTFKTFAVKIVMTSNNSVDVPKIRDLRVIALPEG
jgi:hypothetical protein